MYLLIVVPLLLLTSFSNSIASSVVCAQWFAAQGIRRSDADCELKCASARTDMSAIGCQSQCENLCKLDIPQSCLKTQTKIACEFYKDCLEVGYSCGETSYPIGYGYKYCKRFASLKEKVNSEDGGLSAQGIKWRDATLLCLQNKFVDALKLRAADIVCSDLSDLGFSTHVECYTQHGASICDLSIQEKTTILQIPEASDLLSFAGLKQAFGVLWACSPGLQVSSLHKPVQTMGFLQNGDETRIDYELFLKTLVWTEAFVENGKFNKVFAKKVRNEIFLIYQSLEIERAARYERDTLEAKEDIVNLTKALWRDFYEAASTRN